MQVFDTPSITRILEIKPKTKNSNSGDIASLISSNRMQVFHTFLDHGEGLYNFYLFIIIYK